MIRIVLNGAVQSVPDGLTVAALVEHVGLGAGPVAVERNGAVVPRSEHGGVRVAEGDRIEIVHFVGGG